MADLRTQFPRAKAYISVHDSPDMLQAKHLLVGASVCGSCSDVILVGKQEVERPGPLPVVSYCSLWSSQYPLIQAYVTRPVLLTTLMKLSLHLPVPFSKLLAPDVHSWPDAGFIKLLENYWMTCLSSCGTVEKQTSLHHRGSLACSLVKSANEVPGIKNTGPFFRPHLCWKHSWRQY